MYVWWFIKYEILSESSNCFWPQWKTCLKVREYDLWPTSALSAEHKIGRYRNETDCEVWCFTRINKAFKDWDFLNFTWWCLKGERWGQCCYFSNCFLFLLEKIHFLLRTLWSKYYMFVAPICLSAWGGSSFPHLGVLLCISLWHEWFTVYLLKRL